MTDQKSDLRMDAYYFSFKPTGVHVIDLILSAIACAGKAYHSTADWNEPYTGNDSETPVERIQSAANQAAEEWRTKHTFKYKLKPGQLTDDFFFLDFYFRKYLQQRERDALVRLYNAAMASAHLDLNDFVNAAGINGDDAPHQVVEKLQKALRAKE